MKESREKPHQEPRKKQGERQEKKGLLKREQTRQGGGIPTDQEEILEKQEGIPEKLEDTREKLEDTQEKPGGRPERPEDTQEKLGGRPERPEDTQEKPGERPERPEDTKGKPGGRPRKQGREGRKPGEEPENTKLGKGSQAGLIAVCLGMAGIVFLILLNIEKNLLESYEKQEVVTICQTLPQGQLLTGETAPGYLKLQEVEKAAVPQGALHSLEEAYNRLPAVTLEAGTILSQSLLTDKKEHLDRLEHPVVAGFRAEEISQMVCGTLRPGDLIHIFVTEKESGETIQVWENVFVEQVFDGNGVKIEAGDPQSSAQVVNVLLNKEDTAYFYTELAKGTLRVVREY